MNVWFLTMVINGQVTLTSIMGETYADALSETYAFFTQCNLRDLAEYVVLTNSPEINSWVMGTTKATLIAA